MSFLECRMLMVDFQISYARHPCASVPPYLSPLRVVVRRWVDSGLPRARVQRPDDGSPHRTVEDLARPYRLGRPRRPRRALGAPAAVVSERRCRWLDRGVVQLGKHLRLKRRHPFVHMCRCTSWRLCKISFYEPRNNLRHEYAQFPATKEQCHQDRPLAGIHGDTSKLLGRQAKAPTV